MVHDTLWVGVAVLGSVLGFIIWRYASSQNKQHLYSAETLARRTVKKNLNTVIVPSNVQGIPAVREVERVQHRTSPKQLTTFSSDAFKYPLLPKIEQQWHQPTIINNSKPTLARRAPREAAKSNPVVSDDIPYLTLQPQYQPKPVPQRPSFITYSPPVVVTNVTHVNNVNHRGDNVNHRGDNVNHVNHVVNDVNTQTIATDMAVDDAQSPTNRKRTMVGPDVTEDLNENHKKTRKDAPLAQPSATKENGIQAPKTEEKSSLPRPQLAILPKESEIKDKSFLQTPNNFNHHPPSQPATPSFSTVPSTPAPSTPISGLSTTVPSTPGIVPPTPDSYTPQQNRETDSYSASSSKKRVLLDPSQDASSAALLKRRRVPAFSDKKKKPTQSLTVNNGLGEEERDKRVLFMLKKAQDAPPSPASKTPVKSSILAPYKSPYKSTPLHLPKLPKYANRRVSAPAPAPTSLPTWTLVAPSTSSDTSISTISSSSSASAPMFIMPTLPSTASTLTTSLSIPSSTSTAASIFSTVMSTGSAPPSTSTTPGPSVPSTSTTPPASIPAPVMATPTFGNTLSVPSSTLSTPTFGFQAPPASSSSTSTTSTTSTTTTSTAPVATAAFTLPSFAPNPISTTAAPTTAPTTAANPFTFPGASSTTTTTTAIPSTTTTTAPNPFTATIPSSAPTFVPPTAAASTAPVSSGFVFPAPTTAPSTTSSTPAFTFAATPSSTTQPAASTSVAPAPAFAFNLSGFTPSSTPSFAAPTSVPTFTAPTFTAPSFTAPSFTAPSFTAPSFSAPSAAPPTFTASTSQSGNMFSAAPAKDNKVGRKKAVVRKRPTGGA